MRFRTANGYRVQTARGYILERVGFWLVGLGQRIWRERMHFECCHDCGRRYVRKNNLWVCPDPDCSWHIPF